MKKIIIFSLLISSIYSIASENSGSHLGGVQGGGTESDRIHYESGSGMVTKPSEKPSAEKIKESVKEKTKSK